MADLESLRKIAEAATPGKWLKYKAETGAHYLGADRPDMATVQVIGDMKYTRDVDFTSTFNPALVSKLLDVVEAAKARHKEWTRETYLAVDESLKAMEAEVDK